MNHPDYAPLWRWVRERERIRLLKESGAPPPWTDDPILRKYRFCCVRREDDRVTRWIHEHVRHVYADHPLLWLMLCICRQLNWPATLEEVIDQDGAWPGHDHFDPGQLDFVLRRRRARGDKVYTGAYTIAAPATGDKQTYIAQTVIGDLHRRRDEFVGVRRIWRSTATPHLTLRQTHQLLRASPGWGNFMAYQAVVDMRFCPQLLAEASDVSLWAAAGPGTIRGLNRVHGRPVVFRLRQDRALVEMLEIHRLVESETGVAVDLSDVPNILCETDKYLRVQQGEGVPRALYVSGRGA